MTSPLLAQLSANSLVVASQYALMALGFILIYRVSRVFHFAHGVTFILGPYLVVAWGELTLVGLIASSLLAVAACGIFGASLEYFVYRHLRRSEMHNQSSLVASLGLYIVFQNLISVAFGDETRTIASHYLREAISMNGIRLTIGQLVGILLAVIGIALLQYILRFTLAGKHWRACAENMELANIVGIDVNRSMRSCFFWGSVLAGLSGIIVCFDVDINPTRGMQALITAFVIYALAADVYI